MIRAEEGIRDDPVAALLAEDETGAPFAAAAESGGTSICAVGVVGVETPLMLISAGCR